VAGYLSELVAGINRNSHFIKSMGLPGRKVARIVNPKTGDVLYGRRSLA
jgi:hypothetical protein